MPLIEADAVWTPAGLETGKHVAIEGDTIIGLVPSARQPADVRLPGRLLLPGLVNVHSHAFQRALRGHVQWIPEGRDDFWSWRDRMYATANRLTPEGVEAVSALAFLEMVQAGVTHVGEFHYLHHAPDGTPYPDPDELARRVVRAARRVGLRITLLRVAYARAGAGQPLRPDQARFGDPRPDAVLASLDRLADLTSDDAVQLGLAAHSVRALNAEWLHALAVWPGIVHAHVSEQPAENEAALAEYGCSPLRALANAGLVTERFTAVHLTWPQPGDVELLVETGAGVCACPSTELDLGDGVLPTEVLQRVPVSVGSDSHARIDLLGEARALELQARGVERRRNVLAPIGSRDGLAHRLLQAATECGERALGRSHTGIVAGAPADLVAVDLRHTAAEGVPPLQAAAFVADPGWIDHVWVGGVAVLTDGQHPLEAEIRAAARPWLVHDG